MYNIIHISDNIIHTDDLEMHSLTYTLQGGEDPEDALNCRSFFAKEPLIIGLFCGK